MSLLEYDYEITDKSSEEEWEAWEYKILHKGSGGGSFAQNSSQATITYICEYNYVERFLDTILGKTVKTEFGPLVRSAGTPDFDDENGSTPEEHPYFYNFFAATAEVQPYGTSENTEFGPLWKKASVVVVFRPIDYLIISDEDYEGEATEVGRYVTKVPEGQADFLTSNGRFYWVGITTVPPVPLDIQPGQIVTSMRYTYTWHQIPTLTVTINDKDYPDLKTIPNAKVISSGDDPLIGCINEFEFDGFAPGTLLLSSYSAKLVMPQVGTTKNYYWDITYILAHRDYGEAEFLTSLVDDEHMGWNYAYDPVRGIWDLYTAGDTLGGTVDGDSMYQYKDFNDLFDPTKF